MAGRSRGAICDAGPVIFSGEAGSLHRPAPCTAVLDCCKEAPCAGEERHLQPLSDAKTGVFGTDPASVAQFLATRRKHRRAQLSKLTPLCVSERGWG
jgi:hypothetical protein